MWEAKRDVFTFQVQQPLANRNVLSSIASLFDPLQFLAPFTVRAKVLTQEIWMAGGQQLHPTRDNAKKTEHPERWTTTRAHMTRSHVIVIIDPNKFSHLKRLVHVTGCVQRFLTNSRLPMNLRRKDQILLPIEISEAETVWYKQAQAQAQAFQVERTKGR